VAPGVGRGVERTVCGVTLPAGVGLKPEETFRGQSLTQFTRKTQLSVPRASSIVN